MNEVKLSEADVKLAVEQRLQYQANLGKLIYFRLNAGDFIIQQGNSRRRIKGAGKGTADYIVIQPVKMKMQFQHMGVTTPEYHTTRVTFIELKATDGKQSRDQAEFEQMVKGLNCRYVLVRDAEELEELLK